MTTVLITGANRGLGLEFARQYAAARWRVFACCRHPEQAAALQEIAAGSSRRVTLHALDVADHAQIDNLARALRDESIDILLNNAGIYGPEGMRFGQIDYQIWAHVFAVNTMGPMKMAESFIEQVARSERKIIAALTSEMGSIARNEVGHHYLYRSSKAALNMVFKCLAIDLRDRSIIPVVLHPGWVRTDMGGPNAPLEAPESVQGMRRVLDGLQMADSGKFFAYQGTEIPW
jgi:NAD(P)-dependent dehydrogenase (short-subunit alcohol dehydrogenase family)